MTHLSDPALVWRHQSLRHGATTRPFACTRAAVLSAAVLLLAAAPSQARQPLPMVNLRVEFRQIDEAMLLSRGTAVDGVVIGTDGHSGGQASGGVTLSNRRSDDSSVSGQQVQVLNGGRASLQIMASIPVQWVQAVGVSGASGEPTVVQTVTWLDAGRSLMVQPRWPGGSQPATVEVQVDGAALDPLHGRGPLPAQTRQQTVTSVLAPLGLWVTLARSAGEQSAQQRGTLSIRSQQSTQRQLLQIRVLAP